MGRRIRRQKKARDCRSEIHRAGMRASALAGVDEAFSFMERRLATGSERELLPSQQTLPDWKVPSSNTFRREEWLDHPVPDVSAKFAYVAGSELIDEQIRSILPGTCAQRTGNNKQTNPYLWSQSPPERFRFEWYLSLIHISEPTRPY